MNRSVLLSEDRPTPPWTPPLGVQSLHELLVKIRQWQPFDAAALLDDVGDVLDDIAPPAHSIHDLAGKLRGHLVRLVQIAAGGCIEETDKQVGHLLERAAGLSSEAVPDAYWQAVGYLRQIAWMVNELAERLVDLGCLKAVPA